MKLGALKAKLDIREYHVSGVKANNIEIPAEFELKMPAVKNQENVGSCVAHSIATVVEYFNLLQEGNDKQFSTGYIYGNRRNTTWTGEGMYVDKALAATIRWGDVYNEQFNYNVEVPDAIHKFESQAFDLAPDAYPHRLSEFYRLDTDEERKLQLLQNGPIVFSIAWYKDYTVDKKTKQLVHSSDEIAGYHAMVIYGWNELGWKIQNSWGITFGSRGRAILPYNTTFNTCYGVKDTITSKQNEQAIEQFKKDIEKLTQLLSEKEKLLEECMNSSEEFKQQIEEYQQQIKSIRKTLDAANEQLKHLEELQQELIEIKKPFENMPDWLAKVINWILNIFRN